LDRWADPKDLEFYTKMYDYETEDTVQEDLDNIGDTTT